jgi:hypothetical protein
MNHYKNLSGDSGVAGYETSADSVTVYFQDGSAYLYNATKPGLCTVQQLQKLAEQGQGLNSFIKLRVKTNYACKLR